jgi:hypothetical protein
VSAAPTVAAKVMAAQPSVAVTTATTLLQNAQRNPCGRRTSSAIVPRAPSPGTTSAASATAPMNAAAAQIPGRSDFSPFAA